MPRDMTPEAKAADYRRYAGGDFLEAAKYAFSGCLWMASHKADEGKRWAKRADDLEKDAAGAARIERECAAFDAAMAECAENAPLQDWTSR